MIDRQDPPVVLTTLVVAVLVLFVADAARAQAKPDFSGNWVLANPTDASPDIPRVITVRQIVDRRATPPLITIAVRRERDGRVDTDSYTVGVGTLWGSTAAVGPTVQSFFSTSWSGNRLVIRSVVDETEHTEMWGLSAQGEQLLMAVTDRRDGAVPTMNYLVYRRRS